MSLNEIFDVFNEQMVRIGEATRQSVHAQGLWHQTFHILDSKEWTNYNGH
jgi:hypothetical protein